MDFGKISFDFKYIAKRNSYVEDDCVNAFHSILYRWTHSQPCPMDFLVAVRNITPIDPEQKHIQLLFCGANYSVVGHWVCLYYNGDSLQVYDSQCFPFLPTVQQKFVDALFPFKPRMHFADVQRQTDGYTCGVFAIAYATTLALGGDPTTLNYNLLDMRPHMVRILRSGVLTPFPSTPRLGCASSNMKRNVFLAMDFGKIYFDMSYILDDSNYVGRDCINEFHYILTSRTKSLVCPIDFLASPSAIIPIDARQIHIQLLFYGRICTRNGHWVCLYYNGNALRVFDSLLSKSLPSPQKEFVNALFPFKPRILFPDVQKQSDIYDSGVFAIAFATALALRKNPSYHQFTVDEMRGHLLLMLRSRELEPFPSYPRQPSVKTKLNIFPGVKLKKLRPAKDEKKALQKLCETKPKTDRKNFAKQKQPNDMIAQELDLVYIRNLLTFLDDEEEQVED